MKGNFYVKEETLRIIIAGGRDFKDYDVLKQSCIKILKELHNESAFFKQSLEIVSGTASGADKFGEVFAETYKLKLSRFPAKWDVHGKSAGYIRNKEMAEYASQDDILGVLIAFWDGKSKGTKLMIDLAKKYNLRVFVVNY